MSLHRRFAVAVTALLLAGCGASSGGSGSGDADPAQVMPASTALYVEGVVRPEGEQRDNADALLDRFLGGRTLEDIFDDSVKDSGRGQTYAKDVEPWLGQRIGIAVTNLGADSSGFVAGVAVRDTDKAAAFVERNRKGADKKSYQDTDYYRDDDTFFGLSGDYILIAQDEAQLKRAVDAGEDKSLGDSERFQRAVGELPEERLGALYLDFKDFGKLIRADPDAGAAGGAVFDKLFAGAAPVTAALTAQPDAATIESRVSKSFTKNLGGLGLLGAGASTPLVREAPQDSIAVFGSPDVGSALKSGLETFAGAFGGAALTGSLEQQTGINLERDLFSWIGDVAVFVRGEAVEALSGAVVIEVTDKAAARAAVPRLVAAAKRNGAAVRAASVPGAAQAFAAPIPGAPAPVVLAQGGDRVVVAFGERAAEDGLRASSTIADSGLYDRAKAAVDDLDPSLILDAPAIVKLIEQTAQGDPDFAQAKTYLDQLDLVATGAEEDGDSVRSLFTVKAK